MPCHAARAFSPRPLFPAPFRALAFRPLRGSCRLSFRSAMRVSSLALALLIAFGLATAEAAKVRLETNVGPIVLELDSAKAPQTVRNFLAYVDSGHYDGTVFHRVIRGFMIQGGGFDTELRQKPTRAPIRNEADNGLRNRTGTIAMARTNDPHSATAQFFINTVDNAPLDHSAPTARGWGYAVFGRVVEGMNVVQAIEAMPTTARGPFQNLPRQPLVIERAVVLER